MSKESQEQINKLAEFIIAEVPGEPSRSESSVECIIRVVRELQDRVDGLWEVLRFQQEAAMEKKGYKWTVKK